MSLNFSRPRKPQQQQRERFVSSINIRQIAMPQCTYLQVNHLFLELFAVSRTGVADQTSRTASSPTSRHRRGRDHATRRKRSVEPETERFRGDDPLQRDDAWRDWLNDHARQRDERLPGPLSQA